MFLLTNVNKIFCLFQSFFGRSYANHSSITACKNNSRCVINKKNRTSCKACRLKKCLSVGMSKGSSRYGRRSNWFKIHCVLEQQRQQSSKARRLAMNKGTPPPRPNTWPLDFFTPSTFESRLHYVNQRTSPREERGFEEFKIAHSPTISSPDSHHSDSSLEVGDRIKPQYSCIRPNIPAPFVPYGTLTSIQSMLHVQPFIPPLFHNPIVTFSPPVLAPRPLSPPIVRDSNQRRFHLDAILRAHEESSPDDAESSESCPIDLSLRSTVSCEEHPWSDDDHITVDGDVPELIFKPSTPLDLTTKVQSTCHDE